MNRVATTLAASAILIVSIAIPLIYLNHQILKSKGATSFMRRLLYAILNNVRVDYSNMCLSLLNIRRVVDSLGLMLGLPLSDSIALRSSSLSVSGT